MRKQILFLSLVALGLSSCLKDDNNSPNPVDPVTPTTPVSEGGIFKPSVGGATQPNQVFIDLSAKSESTAKRDSWDFGFYCGNEFRVILNSTVKMAAKQLETTNIDEVQTEDPSVAVGFSTPATSGYVDGPWGEINSNTKGRGTAIAEISATESEHKVYLVNMGASVPTDASPQAGATALEGDSRGWKKIRVTRNGNDYVIDYAELNATTHQSITVRKNPAYNFVFVSLNQGKVVNVQPEKAKWDIAFSPLINYTATRRPATLENSVTYYFADVVTTNILGNVRAQIIKSDSAEKRDQDYAAYDKAKANEINFNDPSLNQQLVIGASWRNTFNKVLYDNVFYVIEDAEGNLFKLKFVSLMNEQGVRGYPVFEYALLK